MTITIDTALAGAAANSYATLAEANAYLEARLNVAEWTAAVDETKKAALVQAAKMVDMLSFKGYKSTGTQALKWPRIDVLDGDGWLVSVESIPAQVKDAQCEMALALLKEDRTEDGGVAPINAVKLGELYVQFNTSQNRKMVPDVVRSILRQLVLDNMSVKLLRT